MAIPYTGLFIAASCNSRSSHGQVHTVQYRIITTWNRIVGTISTFVMTINTFLLPTQQWLLALDDRPCAHYVQSTRRMSLTPTRPSTKGSTFLLGPHVDMRFLPLSCGPSNGTTQRHVTTPEVKNHHRWIAKGSTWDP
jgi:hypothetical protein